MNNKRETIKKVAGVSAVVALAPTSWTKPVLRSLVLPAHAQTSSGLSLNAIDDILFNSFLTQDPRVISGDDNLSAIGFNIFRVIEGNNISPNAVLTIINDPTATPNDLGTITVSGLEFTWTIYAFQEDAPDSIADNGPVGEYILTLKVTNPDSESAEATVRCLFT